MHEVLQQGQSGEKLIFQENIYKKKYARTQMLDKQRFVS
jgi:hypothetical protein